MIKLDHTSSDETIEEKIVTIIERILKERCIKLYEKQE